MQQSHNCPECSESFDDGDYLTDHLTDVHDAYSWTTAGRPIDRTEVQE